MTPDRHHSVLLVWPDGFVDVPEELWPDRYDHTTQSFVRSDDTAQS